jgi:hypothetical protein
LKTSVTKKITMTLLTCALIMPVAASAMSSDDIARSLCEYVAVDDKKRLRYFLKSKSLKIRSIFDSVKCNGNNLLEFAAVKGSLKTGSLIISKLPKGNVKDNVKFLEAKSPELTVEAKERVS